MIFTCLCLGHKLKLILFILYTESKAFNAKREFFVFITPNRTQYNATQRNATQRNATQHNTAERNATQQRNVRNTQGYNTQHNATQSNVLLTNGQLPAKIQLKLFTMFMIRNYVTISDISIYI